ncbi:ABSCISIC ACID-INSENSITIVE 5-like protein 2 [Acorus calamus]|uniref:ABSCISIC ACID-INSENSITIVE 5-like protein 2 n=1 Tax=Acorus calamus TaxID=4465 RepID=A0AAV9DF63_ACOCL|nr:ABSCISIC ACID-INSENSITIVE 5-like protein 2 [Acorus calamus]
MALSRVMGSSSTANPSPSAYSLASMGGGGGGGGEKGGLGSMNMEELLRNMYADNPPSTADMLSPAAGGEADEAAVGRTAEEVWREISGGGGVDRKMEEVGEGGSYGGMTLEDFLAKAGAVSEEDIRVPVTGDGVYMGDQMYEVQQQQMEVAFVNGVEAVAAVGGGGGGGRGKRRAAVQEPVVAVDRVAQQRQRRMIKNRESAARSRERKQAYTVELESQVTQLEEEHARLVKVQEELTRKRLHEES